ncbi:MAG: FAD-dependent oxidoreductase [Janthinobacterium lividum]
MPGRSDIVIRGAGVIGLSLALELRSRGYMVTVLEQGTPLAQASTAAAGMLAVEDPHNPPELLPMARLSRAFYPSFLARIEALSGISVPFQTEVTWQTMPGGDIRRLAEHSLDPRQLAGALLAAAEAAGVRILHGLPDMPWQELSDATNKPYATVYTTGAWGLPGLPVAPRKGQMVRVRVPSGCVLSDVYRSEHVYVVPRMHGPQAGTALIGATVEDAGYDTSTTPAALARLREMGAELVPVLGDAQAAPAVEAWAGLRPTTLDGLPVLSRWENHGGDPHRSPEYVATGHFRNGILLAPATALLMADLIGNQVPGVDLEPFSADRFVAGSASRLHFIGQV